MNRFYSGEISSIYGSKYEDGRLLGCWLCSLVEVHNISEVLVASIIRAV
jgi:hypothetical protein